jgi:protein involved in polysaccharide export with SLBB domain
MGEIRTVKGRERERATAVERVVVTPQRQKLLGKSMPRHPHNRRGYVRIECIRGAAWALPPKRGARPGNFVTLPDQIVDSDGNITVPYAGTIRAAGRTPLEVQQAIIEALTRR